MASDKDLKDKRGEQIKFISGVYKKKKGWLNNDKQPTQCYTYVILKDDKGKLKGTRVKHESFVLVSQLEGPAESYEEGVFKNNADVHLLMKSLAAKLAEFEEITTTGEGGENLARMMMTYIDLAIEKHNNEDQVYFRKYKLKKKKKRSNDDGNSNMNE